MIKNFSTNGVIKTYSMYNGEVKLNFNENGHRYSIDGEEKVGVTTILKTVIAKEALLNWAVKLCADHLVANFKPDTKYTLEQITEIVDCAKKQHRTVKEGAADIGLRVHGFLEEYIKARITGANLPILDAGSDMDEPVKAFLNWEQQNKVVFEESEKPVYSRKYNYAGTLDFLATVNGQRIVGDIKTSNAIYPESYYLQVAAYRYALCEEHPELKIHGMMILKVPKNKKSTFEIRMVNDYEDNAKAFIYAVFLYRQIMKLKNFNKK